MTFDDSNKFKLIIQFDHRENMSVCTGISLVAMNLKVIPYKFMGLDCIWKILSLSSSIKFLAIQKLKIP